MTTREAEDLAAKLGLEVWTVEASLIGGDGQTITIKCVGFEDIGLAMGEGETWEEALNRAAHLIYSA